jgi:hypothetical protein
MTRPLFHDICLALITICVIVATFKGWGWA